MTQKPVYILFLSILLFPGILFAQNNTFKVDIVPFSTQGTDEFSPVYYNNGIVYCSNLSGSSMISYQNKNKGLYNLYFVEKSEKGKWKNVLLLSTELTTPFNEGPATFNESGDKMFFCRNNNIEKQIKDIIDTTNRLGLYYAEKLDGIWSNVTSFKYNNPAYFFLTPALSADGEKLYFASNMPGGYGGTDLYYCNWNGNEWDGPVNLGPVINTPKNELYPFACQSGKLFFASDGHDGYGGKDIFYTQEFDNGWINPVHLGNEINSLYDDFGLITDPEFQTGYFSSNRKRTDDIYRFERNLIQFDSCIEQKEDKFCFTFFDEKVVVNDTISTNYEWNFNTGDMRKGKKVRYCFPGPGKYSVTLLVMNANTGDTLNIPSPYSFELKRIEQPYINSLDTVYTKDTIDVDAFKTHLPGFAISDYHWDFGDGFTQHGPTAGYSYNKKGNYTVKLGVTGKTDSLGNTEKVCVYKLISVINNKKR